MNHHVERPLQWHNNGQDGVSNHQPHQCWLKRLFRRRSKKTSKLRVTGCCAGNSPVTDEFPAQRASNVENVSIWWRHHVKIHHCPQSEFPAAASGRRFYLQMSANEYSIKSESRIIRCHTFSIDVLISIKMYYFLYIRGFFQNIFKWFMCAMKNDWNHSKLAVGEVSFMYRYKVVGV